MHDQRAVRGIDGAADVEEQAQAALYVESMVARIARDRDAVHEVQRDVGGAGVGDAAFDRGVGVSRYTGAVTHHIAPDIDVERATLAADLEAAGMVMAKYQVTGVGPTLAGRNGGGDPYYTDGEVWVLRLVENCRKNTASVVDIASPLAVQLKDQIWQAIAQTLRK